MNTLQEKIEEININITNLTHEKIKLIMDNVEPIVNKIIKDLRLNNKEFSFDYSVDNPYWSDENCSFTIKIRFPSGYSFKERLQYKHKLTEYVHNKINDDFISSKIYVTGAI